MTDKLKGQLQFLAEADKMKNVFRQTRLADRSRQENDAEHWLLMSADCPRQSTRPCCLRGRVRFRG